MHVGYLHVLSDYRRRGVGRQLLEAAADWADEKDSQHVIASVAAQRRDANRFLARLGMGQVAVVRASTVVSSAGQAGKRLGKRAASHIVAARRLTQARRPPDAGLRPRLVAGSRWRDDHLAGDPRRADAPVLLVGDHDLVARDACDRGASASRRR